MYPECNIKLRMTVMVRRVAARRKEVAGNMDS